MTQDQTTQQLIASLAARLDKLEAKTAASGQHDLPTQKLDQEKYWVLSGLEKGLKKGGEVVYAGNVTTPTGEQYLWQRHGAVNDIFKRDWASLDAVLGALAHPVRLRLLKTILEGQQTKAELEKLDGIGTTGQLYHHLKSLEEGGWVRSLQRGTYGVPGERVVPLLVILTAAAG
jgi:DNA-binding transcriptional ArsR family regulator